MTPAEMVAASKPHPARSAERRRVLWRCAMAVHRTRLGLTLRDVEKAIGISNAALSSIEQGYGPTLETAWKLAAFFGVSIPELWQPLAQPGEPAA